MTLQQPEPILVCNLQAIPKEQRAAHEEITQRIFAAIQEIRELPTGYALRLPNESAMLYNIAAYISNERLCCPFFHFVLDVEPEQGEVWLQLTGNVDIKPFMRGLVDVAG
jgi:hypothetical protein